MVALGSGTGDAGGGVRWVEGLRRGDCPHARHCTWPGGRRSVKPEAERLSKCISALLLYYYIHTGIRGSSWKIFGIKVYK